MPKVDWLSIYISVLIICLAWFGCCNPYDLDVVTFNVVSEVSKNSSFCWILVSSFCSGWMCISFIWSKPLIWVLVSYPSLLVPCIFSFISLFIDFIFSSNLWPYSTNSVTSWLPGFWTVHLIGWLSLHRLVVFFLELWSILSFGPYFSVWACLLHSKGRSLRCSSGQGNPGHCTVVLYAGEGSEREQCRLLRSQPAFSPFPHYLQTNWALLVLIPRWVGLCTF